MGKISHFGEHLMIDGYGGSHEKLNSKALVFKFLNELPGKLGMQKLSKPEIYFAPGNGKSDPGGWSGFVVIVESHLSIHTFPKKGFVSADVYTCLNDMDQDFIRKYIKKLFALKELEQNFVKRGLKYNDIP